MPNQQMWVLDEWGSACPFGVTGEIHIGGLGVAQGYWQAETLTRERFIYHPTYGRLYKTGDLGRWSAEGYIEFLGRRDAQVKLNGYRVELEDIENNLSQLPGIRQTIVRLSEGDLMAYVVPEAQQPVPLYFANRDAFVLSLPALRQDLQPSRAIPYPLDEAVYRARKSTRQFTAEALSAETISSLYEALPGWLTQQMAQEGSALPPASLAGLLAVCAAFRSPQRALPKYRYPSASSLYAVQVYLGLPAAMGEYAAGYYYYHPLEQHLYQAEASGEHTGPYLDLVVRWETITALYAERAFALAQIEVGHMLALLTEHLQSLGVAYYVKPADAVSPDEGALACRIHLGVCAVTSPPQVSVDFSVMENEGGTYVARASGRHYCLGETSVLAESSDVYGVLQSSQVLLQAHGAKNACHYQASGWMMQRFGALAAQRRIGGCILGVTPAEDTLCSMAIGYARAEDEPAFDVPALTVSMTQAIRRHLARRLPDYMLPQHVTLIPEIPLSNNGKVDTSRLPKVVKHSECLAPRSDDEIRMRRLWAELLDKREERIGCDQSFFTQGGNSLLAMRLVRKINLATGTEMRLEDLYNNNTIQEMAAWVAGQPCGNGREEGAL
jgi:aryl carrier-like protein